MIFQLNLWTKYLPIGTLFEGEIFSVDTTFRALQDEILFNQFGNTRAFWEKSHVIGQNTRKKGFPFGVSHPFSLFSSDVV